MKVDTLIWDRCSNIFLYRNKAINGLNIVVYLFNYRTQLTFTSKRVQKEGR